jgi:hypothetical protein
MSDGTASSSLSPAPTPAFAGVMPRWTVRSQAAGLGFALAGWLCGAAPAHAGVYASQEEALALAFPGAERIERRNFVLTPGQREAIQKLSRAPLGSALLTVHVARSKTALLGFAMIDVHVVRTQSEALMVVLDPQGAVRSVRVLAFYEPEEYLPSERFREQYAGRTIDTRLRLDGEIQTVAGATLSSRATTRAVRQAIAVYRVLLASAREADDSTAAAPAGRGGPGAPARSE